MKKRGTRPPQLNRRRAEGRRPWTSPHRTPSKTKVETQPYAPTHASCDSTCSAAARRMFQRMSLLTAATYARADETTTSVSEPEPENFLEVVYPEECSDVAESTGLTTTFVVAIASIPALTLSMLYVSR